MRIWLSNGDSTWSSGGTIFDGQAFYGLALGDIDKDGYLDMAFGTPEEQNIYIYLSADSLLDLVDSTQGSGVMVWTGTSRLDWSYWYHPIVSGVFRGFTLKDLTFEGSKDLVAASDLGGIYI